MHSEANVFTVTDNTANNTLITHTQGIAHTNLSISRTSIPTTIAIEPNELIVTIGYSGIARITVYDQTNTLMPNTTVTGLSSSTSVATVDSSHSTDTNGQAYFYIYGISGGNTTVTFYAGSMSNSIPVSVVNIVLPSSLTLDKTALSVATNKEGTITAMLLDQNKAPISNSTIQANSNNTNIATVDSSKTTNTYGSATFGITGKSVGNAVITFTSGVLTATATVSVLTEMKVTSMNVEPSEFGIPVNYSGTATVTVLDQDNGAMSDVSVTATSSYTGVATVSSSQTTNVSGNAYFTINGVSIGSATVNFIADNISKSIPVSVLDIVPASLFVNKNMLVVLKGQKGTVTVTLFDKNNVPIPNVSINANSGNTSTASVSPNAKAADSSGNASFEITGISEGNTKTYFRAGTLTASTFVAVVLTSVATTLDITPSELKIPINYDGTATVTVLDQYKTPLSGINVSASSDYTSIATVDGSQTTNTDGLAFFTVYGISVGSATVNFIANNISNSLVASVLDIFPSSLVLDSKVLTVPLDKTGTITATVRDQNGALMSNVKVDAVSSDTNIATLDSSIKTTNNNGQASFVVLGESEGKTNVSFSAGTVTTTASVSVNDLIPSRIVFSEKKLKLSQCESGSVTVKVVDSIGTPIPDVVVSTIISEKESNIAEISPTSALTDENGEASFSVIGLRKGKITIKFDAGEISEKLRVSIREARIVSLGTEETITITVFQNGQPKSGIKITADSSDTDVVVVEDKETTDTNGEAKFTVTGVGEGNATITFVTSSGSTLEENIVVIKTAQVEVSENNISISVGTNQSITVTATDVNNDPITDTSIYATIKSGGKRIEVTPYEQTTDESGSASFTITGVAEGKAKVEFGVCGLSEKVKIEVYQ